MVDPVLEIPRDGDLLTPILRVLSDGEIWSVDELVSGVIKDLNLPESILDIKATKRDRPELKSRIEWVCSLLKKKGLIEYPETDQRKSSNRRILPLGLEMLNKNADLKTVESMSDVDERKTEPYPTSYDPGITTEGWIQLLKDPVVFNQSSLKLMSEILSFGGEVTCTQLAHRFGGDSKTYNGIAVNLAKRIHRKTRCPLDSGRDKADRYWPIIFLGRDATKDEMGTYCWILRPELRDALSEIGVKKATSGDIHSGCFFDFLEEQGLRFDVKTVENFLLSLKAKQFVILSGGTGTGKTRLAQAYGEYISSNRHSTEIRTQVTIGKSANSNGFTLKGDDFFKVFPDAARRNGVYNFVLGDCEGKCRISMAPRFWFVRDEHREEIVKTLERMKNEDDEAELIIKVPNDCEGDNYRIVPVGSNWTDSRHILGYRNAISGKYMKTPSLELLLSANDNCGQQYMLILDEMNLSHVERYFSDIISCMESGEPIHLDSDGEVPESFSLGDNLFVVGTVNMDETTYTFSPKVLDRANVLEFRPASVREYLSEDKFTYSPTGDVDFLQDCRAGLECRELSAGDILSAMSSDSAINVIQPLVDDLEALQNVMTAMGLPFAYRTLNEVMRFMYVAWIYEGGSDFNNWKRYMDAQIHQKILPKIHGNVSILNSLRTLREFCENRGYTESEGKLKRMITVLESQRYVSFNC